MAPGRVRATRPGLLRRLIGASPRAASRLLRLFGPLGLLALVMAIGGTPASPGEGVAVPHLVARERAHGGSFRGVVVVAGRACRVARRQGGAASKGQRRAGQ